MGGDALLGLLSAAIISCAGVPELSPPDRGSAFLYAGPGGLYVHEIIEDSDRSGGVGVRMAPSRSPSAPSREMMSAAPRYTSFMGMILIENAAGDSRRSRSLPGDLLSRVNRLEPGETIAFPVRHETRLGGDVRTFTETHEITFLGCDVVSAGQGQLQVRQYRVDTAGLSSVRGRSEIRRTRKRVDIAVDLGWVSLSDDGAGAFSLVRARPAR